MNNNQVIAGIRTRVTRSVQNALEIGEYVSQWDGSLQALADALDGDVSKGTLSKCHTMFKHWGTDAAKCVADVKAAGMGSGWTEGYNLLKQTAETPTVSDGNDEGEPEGETAGTADPRRIVKIDLDDPLAALLKLDTADVAALATAVAAILVDRELVAA
jgi:hypothetical protein